MKFVIFYQCLMTGYNTTYIDENDFEGCGILEALNYFQENFAFQKIHGIMEIH